MSNLPKLRFQRGQFKATLTRFRGFVNSIDLNNIDEITITQLKVRLDKIKPILNEFTSVQASIEFELSGSETAEQELQQECNEIINFEKSYFELISYTQNLINNFEYKNADITSSITVNKNSVNSLQAHFKLPDIKLPIYRGSFETWLEFRDTYHSLVHHNANISPIQKFYYLKSCLEGEPLKLISSVEVSENNYSVAWSMIKDRYENKKLIVHNYIKGLFDSPIAVKESHTELRNLHDNFRKNLRSLKVLGLPTDSWDALLVYMLCTKFDNITKREWESYRTQAELPTVDEILEFLKRKCELLEKLEITKGETKTIEKQFSKFQFNKSNRTEKTRSFNTTTERKITCYFCKQEHSIFQCEGFRELDIPARINQVKILKLCTNCFDPNHMNIDCKRSNCRICKKRHNSLLHLSPNNSNISSQDVNKNENTGESTSGTYMTSTQEGEGIAYDRDRNRMDTTVRRDSAGDDKVTRSASRAYNVAEINNSEENSQPLLSTAVIRVHGKNRFLYARVLLDAGSQSHFISERLVQQLKLDKKPVNYSIVGVGESKVLAAQHKTEVNFGSRINNYKNNISCLIIPKIAQKLPNTSFKVSSRSRINELTLADPNYNLSQDIDMLLGVGIFYDILIMEQKKIENMPILQNTQLGWIFGGNIPYVKPNSTKTISCVTVNESLENALTKFWTVEECDNERVLTKDEKFCEEHFVNNVKRTPEGRFIVNFPFKDNVKNLGQSDKMAVNRFYALERRLNKDKLLKNDYCDFIKEYIELGHMRKLEDFNINTNFQDGYFLPHHAVVKNSSITTRTRIVFDASAKSDSGISLNDVQYVGPTLQDDLFSIILRFRQYKYVLNGDISKMYRQVLMDPRERKYLRIFWRDNDEKQIECYELNTVTYGTSSAPHLAVRCLQQLGTENKDEYPIASKVILNDFYIDDLLTGSDSLSELRDIQRDVAEILRTGGFQLRKWLCNNRELLEEINVDDNLSSGILHLGKDENNKTLGIYWNAFNDNIQYSIKTFEFPINLSKRVILSTTSQIFDPLGLVGPIIVVAKMFLQRLWQEKLDWDQKVSDHLSVTWKGFCNELLLLNNLKIPRYVCYERYTCIELHGFADASERAYGACIYIACRRQDESYNTQLLCSKSRVCPLKQIALPRLELCAAELLAKLMRKVIKASEITFDQCFYWTDSTVVLGWINGCPNQWKTFVANRVSKIQDLSKPSQWYHIAGKFNPADLLSRGTTVSHLLDSKIWWNGPQFLSNKERTEFVLKIPNQELPEKRILVNLCQKTNQLELPFNKFSNFKKLQRTIAYCLRFISNMKGKSMKTSGILTVEELKKAHDLIMKFSQKQSFPEEYKLLKRGEKLNTSSKLLALNPFIGTDGLIRVGGRLLNADVDYAKQHPILLDTRHHVTLLLLQAEHVRLMHCGPNQLLYSVREQYWPIAGRRLTRSVVKKCIICRKAQPIGCKYLMGNLPSVRVNKYIPFTNVGLDYAGPILIKDRKLRGAKLIKSYICLFICMSTKCVHLELLTDLSSEAFLSMFRRFIGRRGRPSHLFSDNGTSFIGANNELKKFIEASSTSIAAAHANENISWHFIPPRAPNFGGIWESNIKQVKYYLKRILKNTSLTYEDMMTVLIQIEGILNSRPLCPLSSDPSDFNPLTPSHFLLGKTISSIPEPGYVQLPDNRLGHYKYLQKIIQTFWQRWSVEYISDLQTRTKWRENVENLLQVGSLVLVKQEDALTYSWRLGRIIELHRGADNIIRVATVKCSDGSVCKRAISKICVLPVSGI